MVEQKASFLNDAFFIFPSKEKGIVKFFGL